MSNTEMYEESAPVQEASVAEKPRVRRIGVYTMGISLIVIGVSILISMFNPAFDLLLAAKLSPVILVALGLEIIISTTVFRKDKLKYDFWSGFICFLLVLLSISAAFVPILWNSFGPEREATVLRIQSEMEDKVYASLKNVPCVKNASVSFNLIGMDYNRDMTLADVKQSDYTYINVNMKVPDNKEEFSENIRLCMNKLMALDIPYSGVYFRADNQTESYVCSFDGKFDFDDTAAEIAEKISYYRNNIFVEEYENPPEQPGEYDSSYNTTTVEFEFAPAE